MTPIISLSHVTYAYPNSDVPALRDLSLTINKGVADELGITIPADLLESATVIE